MPRGGPRKGSGRKPLDKTRVTVYVDPDTLSLLSGIAMYEKTSIGAAIDKIRSDPDFRFLPAPNAPNELHYSVTLRGSRANLQKPQNFSTSRDLGRLRTARGQWTLAEQQPLTLQGESGGFTAMSRETIPRHCGTVQPPKPKRSCKMVSNSCQAVPLPMGTFALFQGEPVFLRVPRVETLG